MKFTIVTNLWDETGLWRSESLPVSTCLGDVRPSRPRSRSSRGPFSTGLEVVTVAITAGSRVGQAEIGSSIGIAVEEVRVTEDPSEAGDLGTIFGITTAALEVNEVSGDREVSRYNFEHQMLIWLTRAQFHQRYTYSFYACRSQKRKKIQLSHQYLFTLSGSTGAKAERRTLMKLTPVYSCQYLLHSGMPFIYLKFNLSFIDRLCDY